MSRQPAILCFGDSNTHGTPPMKSVTDLDRFPPNSRWPGVVRAVLGERAHIIEEAQPGRTTIYDDPTGGGDRNGLTSLKVALETHRPLDCVVLMLGTNDLHARFNLSAWVISRNINQLVLKIMQMPCGVIAGEPPKVLLVAPPPVLEQGFPAEALTGASEKSRQLAKHYEQVANAADIDFFDAASVISVDPLDGVHFSAESHVLLGNAIAAKLADVLHLDVADDGWRQVGRGTRGGKARHGDGPKS